MLLTLRVTGPHASDLEVLLDKCPDKLHSTSLPFGLVHVFFPEVSPEAVTVALVVDVDAVDWSSNGFSSGSVLANAAMLSAAIANVFGTALAARSPARPDLVTAMLPIEASVSSFATPSGTDDARALFGPLGYDVVVHHDVSDEPSSTPTNLLRQTVRLAKLCPLYEVLSHLYVLGPVLDGHADDRALESARDALLLHAEGAARGHPAADRIMHAYTARRPSGASASLTRLLATDGLDGQTALDSMVPPTLLDDARIDAIVLELREASAGSVVDLGCGDGKLLARLVREKVLTRIVGLDVSIRALDAAASRMKLDRRGGKKSERIELLHGSLFYSDSRLLGFDAAVLVDVVQHVHVDRLGELERVVFHDALPATVVVMMNAATRDGFVPSGLEHGWSTNHFDAWASGVSERRAYRLRLLSIGSSSITTRMAVFRR
jgi:3' terminal RNA ribose 2'-O-methyltransferase Hen1